MSFLSVALARPRPLSAPRTPPPQVGKQITVEYFAESAAQGRPDEPSLRFPRVKRVWEEGVGKRDV